MTGKHGHPDRPRDTDDEDGAPPSGTLSTEEVVEEYAGLVKDIALRVVEKLQYDVPLDDLIEYGYTGLLEAWQRFDPGRRVSFASFAFYRIRGAIYDGCRKEGWSLRGQALHIEDLVAVNDHLESNSRARSEMPSPRTFSDSVNYLEEMVGDCLIICLVRASDLAEVQITDGAPQRDRLERLDTVRCIQAALDSLSSNEREVILKYHFENKLLVDIADEMGLSKSWICRVNARAITKIREYLLENFDRFDKMAEEGV